uniref:FAD-dependent oxidoreductase domain-containing protein 1 n=1 Tax=Romanomermis culicivorax TaxID=13658 RepID=A0A915KVX3_ROMCU
MRITDEKLLTVMIHRELMAELNEWKAKGELDIYTDFRSDCIEKFDKNRRPLIGNINLLEDRLDRKGGGVIIFAKKHLKREIKSLAKVQPQMTDTSPRRIQAHVYVNAAGPWAGDVARMAGIGSGSGLMSVPIPIVPRKRYVYVVHVPDGPGLDMPFLIDPSGVWCRREGLGNLYICGKSPTKDEDEMIDHDTLDVDYDYFDEKIWPILAARMPCFEKLRVKNAWAGWYDFNLFDQNPIIGRHFHHQNFFMSAGFSGHGLQHALTVGRGIMQEIYDGGYIHINYRKYGFERLYENRPLLEDNII